MNALYLVPRQAGGFVAPTFEAPEWDKGKITQLTRAAAAPGMRALRRGMRQALPTGYSPQEVQARRAALEGYGGGLSQVMGGARAAGAAQYGQQYGREFEAAKLGFGAELEGARADWQAGQARQREEFETGEAETRREWQEEQWEREREERENQRWWDTPAGGIFPGGGQASGAGGGYPSGGGGGLPLGGGGAPIRRPEPKMKQGRFSRKEYLRARAGRKKGGPVHSSVQAPVYEVGEEGPELYVPDRGQSQVVGTQGPEARTFSQEGEIIPAPETQEIMNKQMQISYDPPPPLSEEEQTAFDAAIKEYRKTYPQDFEVVPENIEAEREGMLIKRQRGGSVKSRGREDQNPFLKGLINDLEAQYAAKIGGLLHGLARSKSMKGVGWQAGERNPYERVEALLKQRGTEIAQLMKTWPSGLGQGVKYRRHREGRIRSPRTAQEMGLRVPQRRQ